MDINKVLISSGLWFWALFSANAMAVVIEYDQVSQSGNRYEYSYSVTNDSDSTFDIAGISIYFDFSSYENIVISDSPDNWDPYFEDPIPALPFDGLADWFALGAPIAAGETLSGFNVAFDWIGAEAEPFVNQYFEIYDTVTFDLLASGLTQLTSDTPEAVPEPVSLFLLVAGLLGLMFGRSRVRNFK